MEPDLFSIITLCTYGVVFLAAVRWQVKHHSPGWTCWFLYSAARLYVPLCFHFRTNRRCPFPEAGAALIIANHRSPVDPIFIWMGHHLSSRSQVIRIIGFMTAREYYEVPGVKWICETMECIPVDRDGKDTAPTREALRHLKKGQLLALFPEGKINLGDELISGTPGVAWLALTARVPIFPVFIHNAPLGLTMVQPFYDFRRVHVSYGEAIDLSEYFGRRKTHELLVEVTDRLMQQLAETGGVTYHPCGSTEPATTIKLASG
jgi:1-acyl-sn-glycerol-3-phosphate acyltransferase